MQNLGSCLLLKVRTGNTQLYDCVFKLKIFPLLYEFGIPFICIGRSNLICTCKHYLEQQHKIDVGCCIQVEPSPQPQPLQQRLLTVVLPYKEKVKSLNVVRSCYYTTTRVCMERRVNDDGRFFGEMVVVLGHGKNLQSFLMEIYPFRNERSKPLLTFYDYLRECRILYDIIYLSFYALHFISCRWARGSGIQVASEYKICQLCLSKFYLHLSRILC